MQGIPKAGIPVHLREIIASGPYRKDINWKLIQFEVSVSGNFNPCSHEPSNAAGKVFRFFPSPNFHMEHCHQPSWRQLRANP